MINGKRHNFVVTISDELTKDQSVFDIKSNNEVVLSATSSWKYHTHKDVNVNAQRNFSTYTASALGGIMGTIIGAVFGLGFGGGIGMSIGVGMAYNYVAASEYPTNVGYSDVYIYTSGRSPTRSYKTKSFDYAVYKGSNVFLGTSIKYKHSCVGCGV